jgi:adenylate cyclase
VAAQELNVDSIVEWLDGGAPGAGSPQEILSQLCRRMLQAGISLSRVAVFVRTLHPNVFGRGFFWREEREEVEVDEATHDFVGTREHLQSTPAAVWASGREIRRRLADPACPMDYPVLADLRAEGMTDYLVVPLRFMSGEVHAASYATRRPGGFTDAEIAALHRLLPPFSRVAEIAALNRKARNILDAYLGQQAGEKVLAGQIRRGDSEEIRAVIWFCDLRDSTPLADSMNREAFLRLLNDYFECVLGPVQERGGEILRFIGDAALAIFPIGTQPAVVACAKAVDAARDAVARMQELNAKRKQAGGRRLRFGIGLHLGLVLYGNIGTPTRIEFTVIGAAANEAARIEALCKALKVDLILSEHVARHLPTRPRSLGKHALRGVGEPVELFTL